MVKRDKRNGPSKNSTRVEPPEALNNRLFAAYQVIAEAEKRRRQNAVVASILRETLSENIPPPLRSVASVRLIPSLVSRSPVVLRQPQEPPKVAHAREEVMRIRKSLRECTDSWLKELLTLIAQCDSHAMNSPLCITLLEAAVESSMAAGLLQQVTCLVLDHYNDPRFRDYSVCTFLMWMSMNRNFVAQLGRECSSPEVSRSLQMLLFIWLDRGCTFEFTDDDVKEAFSAIKTNEVGQVTHYHCRIPVRGVKAATTLRELLVGVRRVYEPYASLLDTYKESSPDWSLADLLWQKIRDSARMTLHPEGDVVEIDVPDLRAMRLTKMMMKPVGGRFPNITVSIHSSTFGFENEIHFTLEDGRLSSDANSYFIEHFLCRLTLAILIAYWGIVGTDGLVERGCSKKRRRGLNNVPGKRAMAPPHPMRLPEGKHASPEALANACIHLRPAAPGYTFWTPRNLDRRDVDVLRKTRFVVRSEHFDTLATLLTA